MQTVKDILEAAEVTHPQPGQQPASTKLRCPMLPDAGKVTRGVFWLHAWMASQAKAEVVGEAVNSIDDLFLSICVDKKLLKRALALARAALRDMANNDLDVVISEGMLLCAHADTTMVAA